MILDYINVMMGRPMDFVETSQGQELKEKIWKETVGEIGKYTSVPDVISSQ